jgi:hypothetical protein
MEITNAQEIIDSRDIIKRIEELVMFETLDEPETAELKQLQLLIIEGEAATPDWQNGVTLIRDSDFKEYAMEYASDIGAISSDFQWPLGCIDWTEAVNRLQMDYVDVDFNGVTYYVR